MKDRWVTRAWRMFCASALVAVVCAASTGVATARAAAPSLTAPPPTYSTTIRDGRAAARALLDQTGAASLSLALVSNGRVVWRQGFGYADTATKARPGANTMYGVASVSKMLATVATMKLVDEGLVNLDEPFADYVPSFTMLSPGSRDVTVRMLLDHASGFPGSSYGDANTGVYYPGYLQEVLDTLAQSRLKYTPGVMSVYCNDGFTLIEALVPAVTGKSYAEFVQDEILTPLGMTHSAYPLEPFADGTYAKAYDGDIALPREVVNALAAGGLYSTPTDLGRLATMLANGGVYRGTRILSAASVAAMGTDQTLRSFKPAPYDEFNFGLGWDSVSQPGLKAVGVRGWSKCGDSDDYSAEVVVAPKAKLVAVVTCVHPLYSGDCETLCERMLLHALVDQGRLRHMPARIAAVAPPAKTATKAQLSRMEGYWAESGMVCRVRAATGHPQSLTLSYLDSGHWTPWYKGLRLRTDDRFHPQGSPESFRTVAAAGRRYMVDCIVGGYGHHRDDLMFAQKLRPGAPLSAAWQARVGRSWLAVNLRPDSDVFAVSDMSGGPLLTVDVVPHLGGYATVTTGSYGQQIVDPGESDTVGLMFLQIPSFGSENLNDAVVEERGGEEWIRFGDGLYRPQDGVPELAAGPTTVHFGAEGYAEWLSLPVAGQATVGAGSAWRLYDADMAVVDGGTTFPATVDAAAGSSLVLFGPANSSTSVTFTAASPAPGARVTHAAPKYFTFPLRWPQALRRLVHADSGHMQPLSVAA